DLAAATTGWHAHVRVGMERLAPAPLAPAHEDVGMPPGDLSPPFEPLPSLPGEVEDVQRHRRPIGLPYRFEVQPGAVRLGDLEKIVPEPAEPLGGPLAAVRDGPGGVVIGEEVEVAGIRVRRQPGRPPDLHRRAELVPILKEA